MCCPCTIDRQSVGRSVGLVGPSCADCMIYRSLLSAGFYRGLWIPLVTISAVRAASFTIYTNTKNSLYNDHWLNREGGVLPVATAGAAGGALAGSLITFGSVRECRLRLA